MSRVIRNKRRADDKYINNERRWRKNDHFDQPTKSLRMKDVVLNREHWLTKHDMLSPSRSESRIIKHAMKRVIYNKWPPVWSSRTKWCARGEVENIIIINIEENYQTWKS